MGRTLVCQPLFVILSVIGELKKDVTPDADYLFSLLRPHYSREGTSRQCMEEDIMDFFQEILNDYETGNVVGHVAPVALNYKKEDEDTGDENENAVSPMNVIKNDKCNTNHKMYGYSCNL